MTNDLEDFAQWRGDIETRVSTLEATAETETRLRAQMDADMSDLKLEFRSQRRMLQALADTQSEHTATLAKHTATLDQHTATLDQHTATLDQHTATLAEHGVILTDHTERLTRLEAGQARVLAGVETIIGLLDREIEGAAEP